MIVYYNEHDKHKAAWLRELIRAGVVAPGDVDERDIRDVQPADVVGYTQCHFFAGIGVWSYALRLTGWPDDCEVWTGSCPCPSFSCAGKGEGFDDPRHLWPYWARLIRERRPAIVFGEQADDAIGFGWLDLVQTELEAASYAIGKAVLGAASVGAPHIRQRLYFGAYTELGRLQQHDAAIGKLFESDAVGAISECSDAEHSGHNRPSGIATLANSDESKIGILGRDARERDNATGSGWENGRNLHRQHDGLLAHDGRETRECSDASSYRSASGIPEPAPGQEGFADVADDASNRGNRGTGWLTAEECAAIARTGATRGFWRDCEWWYGRDGKFRPIGSGIFPLAHGTPARVLRLRGYGDAIIPQVAAEFIEAFAECLA